MSKIVLKIMVRSPFPELRELVLEGESHLGDITAKLAFDLEQAINNSMPQVRAHISIEESNK